MIFLFSGSLYSDDKDIWNTPTVSELSLGESLLKSKDYWGAINYFERYLLNNPNDNSVKLKLAEAYLKIGINSYNEKRFVDAVSLFAKSIKFNSQVAEAHYYSGLSEQKLNHPDKAISFFEKTESLEKNYKDIRENLVKLYLSRGEEEYKYSHYKVSKNYLLNVLRFEPENLDANFYLGFNTYFLKEWDDSTKYFMIAQKEKKYYLLSNYYMGLINFQSGKYYECIPFFLNSEKKSLKDKSIYYLSMAYYQIAVFAYNKKDYKESEKYYLKVLELFPEHIEANYGIALVYYNMNDYFKSADRFEKIKKLKGNYLSTYKLLAETYFRIANNYLTEKKLKDADKYFVLCYKNNISRGDAYYNVAEISYTWKNYNRALTFYQRAIDKQFKVLDSTYKLGEIKYKTSKFLAATGYLEKVYAWNHSYNNTVEYLWKSYKTLGLRAYNDKDYTQSEIFLKKSLFYNSEQNKMRYFYAVSLFKNSKYESSFVQLKTVLDNKATSYKDFWSYLYKSSFKVAMHSYETGNYNKSIEWWNIHLKYFPKTLDARYYLAISYNRVRNFKDSITYLLGVMKEKYSYKDSLKELVYAYQERGKKLFTDKDVDNAEKLFLAALRLSPKNIECRYYSGLIKYNKRKYRSSITELEKVYKKNKSYKNTVKLLENAYVYVADPIFAKGEYLQVLSLYGRLTQIAGNDGDYHLKYAICLYNKAKVNDAIKEFNVALNKNGNKLIANYYLGEIYYKQKKLEKSLGYLNTAFSINHNYKQVIKYLAEASYIVGKKYEKSGELNKAENLILKAYGFYPDKFNYLLSSAAIEKKIGNIERSIYFYEKFISKFSNYYKAHIPLTELYLHAKSYDKGLRLILPDYKIKDNKFQSARIKLIFNLYLERGKKYFKEKNYKYALESFKKAKKLYNKNRELNFYLSETYIKIGDVIKGAKILSLLSKKNKNNEKMKLSYLYSLVASEYFNSSKYKSTLKYVSKSLKYNEENKDALFFCGYSYGKLNKYQDSLRCYDKLWNLDKNYPSYRDSFIEEVHNYLLYLIKNNKSDEVKLIFKKYKKKFGELKSAYEIGEYFYKLNNYKLAEKYFNIVVLDFGINYMNVSDYLFKIYKNSGVNSYNKGDFNHSREYFDKALRINDKDSEIYLFMAKIAFKEKRLLYGKKYLIKAISLNKKLAEEKDVIVQGYNFGVTTPIDWDKFLIGNGIK